MGRRSTLRAPKLTNQVTAWQPTSPINKQESHLAGLRLAMRALRGEIPFSPCRERKEEGRCITKSNGHLFGSRRRRISLFLAELLQVRANFLCIYMLAISYLCYCSLGDCTRAQRAANYRPKCQPRWGLKHSASHANASYYNPPPVCVSACMCMCVCVCQGLEGRTSLTFSSRNLSYISWTIPQPYVAWTCFFFFFSPRFVSCTIWRGARIAKARRRSNTTKED